MGFGNISETEYHFIFWSIPETIPFNFLGTFPKLNNIPGEHYQGIDFGNTSEIEFNLYACITGLSRTIYCFPFFKIFSIVILYILTSIER